MIFIEMLRNSESDNFDKSVCITDNNETVLLRLPIDTIDYQCFSLN